MSGRFSDGWHLDLTQLKRTWLVGKEWSSTEPCPSLWKKGKPCTTYLWLNKVQLKFHQSCGEILLFLLYCLNEVKKEIFWKAIFYLIWQIWPSSATRFPRCSLCNHMVQLLVKRGRYYVFVNIHLAYIRVKIFPRVDFSLFWTSGTRRAGVSGFRTHYCNLIVKHRQFFSFISLF